MSKCFFLSHFSRDLCAFLWHQCHRERCCHCPLALRASCLCACAPVIAPFSSRCPSLLPLATYHCHLPVATCHLLANIFHLALHATHSGAQLANKFFERLLFWASVDILMNAHESVRLCLPAWQRIALLHTHVIYSEGKSKCTQDEPTITPD